MLIVMLIRITVTLLYYFYCTYFMLISYIILFLILYQSMYILQARNKA